jgi:hypothetical protein
MVQLNVSTERRESRRNARTSSSSSSSSVSKLVRRLRHVRNLAALPDPTSPSLIERVNYLPPVSPGRDSAITDFTDFPGAMELYLPREGTSTNPPLSLSLSLSLSHSERVPR